MKTLASDLEQLIAQLPQRNEPPRSPERTPRRRTIKDVHADQLAAIVSEYQAGATVYELAAQYALNRNSIANVLKRNGVQLRGQGLASEQIDQAAYLYAAGQSLARIGERFGVDVRTVQRRLIERGVTMRPTSQRD